eukprot:TRINITY_DN33622_c0_g1_i1.p1 TRINITY_DN33622_c0_g1~~TRINITY_DN33622_c0_g1_i1.p1  ORF type:complete len:137 (+),score=37.85 TRINITY_DN33622_c0_g1_i1:77-487(+)
MQCCFVFFFQAEDGIRDVERSRGLGDVYKRQLPLVCGLRYMCLKVKEPQPPEKPTPPQRPNKPQEPSIGAKPNEWNEYRKKLTKYKKEKKEFKEDSEYYKKNQTQLMIAYEKMRYKHRKNMENPMYSALILSLIHI